MFPNFFFMLCIDFFFFISSTANNLPTDAVEGDGVSSDELGSSIGSSM